MDTLDADFVTPEPTAEELRDLRRIVEERLSGTVYVDQHSGRLYRLKQAPGKFSSVGVHLTTCDHDHVLCDIPADEKHGEKGPLRICLVCDAGREMLGLRT